MISEVLDSLPGLPRQAAVRHRFRIIRAVDTSTVPLMPLKH